MGNGFLRSFGFRAARPGDRFYLATRFAYDADLPPSPKPEPMP